MKRFHSPLEKVKGILDQQSHMAELRLAQATVSHQHAIQAEKIAAEQLESAHATASIAIKQASNVLMILGIQQHLLVAAEELQKQQGHVDSTAKIRDESRQQFQLLHSKVERLEQLIEKQKSEHRLERLLEEQKGMDDVSISRWKLGDASVAGVNSHE
ncbi:flagellar FliJ family protein [Planctomicrobium sp. SH668]|uniref:flagellar FliJ family protein n=1 Tax=Planctomicrobium sp. SH668 TaxID=3448126 RepID=UPI003F5C450C